MSALGRLPLLLWLLTAACAANPSPGGSGGATVHVDNQAAFDMDISVLGPGGPIRLGFAPAKQVTRFALAPALITGSGIVRFEAHPTLGGEPTLSDPFTVRHGDDLTWVIPPQ